MALLSDNRLGKHDTAVFKLFSLQLTKAIKSATYVGPGGVPEYMCDLHNFQNLLTQVVQ
jgi:hypothetical protein